MGYTTDFTGEFELDQPLASEHYNYLKKFSETRRMARDAKVAEGLPDPNRLAVGLPIGPAGAYFVGGLGYAGQDRDASIVEYNNPPADQPGLWCQWVPNEEGTALLWNGTEKFYYYVEWLEYLVKNFLQPWGYKLNGTVEYQGEDSGDFGRIVVKNNKVKQEFGQKVYGKPKKEKPKKEHIHKCRCGVTFGAVGGVR